jgi:flagellar M-ring protein FliF
VNPFTGLIQRFGLGRIITILGVSAGVAAALFALVLNVASEPKALLYSNLDLKEAGSITSALDQANIKYEVKGDGSTILVQRDKVASTRLMLSSKGLPTSGSVGYEIFDNAPALGQTDFVQNLNRQRALEGELARTVRSLQGVSSARVHLVLPRRQLFEDEAEQPSASVVIGIGGREPSADEVRAIRNLIAGATPNLKPERVTIVDDRGKMLAGGDGSSDNIDQMAADLRVSTEEKIRKSVKDMVEGVVGPGKARVTVSADIDTSRVTTQDEKFDPDGQVIRSTQTTDENSKESKSEIGSSATTAAANIPGGGATPTGSGENGNSSGKTEETTNYEISKSTRTQIQEPGEVKRLSVAVAVDGLTAFDKKGKAAYTARSADEMQRIDALVRSAVGYNAQRGDQVTVVNVRFSHDDDAEGVAAGSPLMGFDKNDIMRGAELIILLVTGALLIFFVARPLLKSADGGGGGGFLPMLSAAAGGGPSAYQQILSHAPPGGLVTDQSVNLPAVPDADARIDIAKIEGQVKVSSVKRVSEFVDKHPEESVSILRSWLHESA